MKKLFIQILQFGIVGGTAFLIDYAILFSLTEFAGFNYLIAGMISFSVAVVYNYILSTFWVFDIKKTRNKKKDFIIFILLSVVGLGLNQLVMWISVDKIGIYYMFAKIIATALVMVYNFITRKMFLESN